MNFKFDKCRKYFKLRLEHCNSENKNKEFRNKRKAETIDKNFKKISLDFPSGEYSVLEDDDFLIKFHYATEYINSLIKNNIATREEFELWLEEIEKEVLKEKESKDEVEQLYLFA